jgi:hypothetical protein
VDFNPNLSAAGLWTPVSRSLVTATYNGALAATFSGLVPFGGQAGYGFITTGWSYPSPTPTTPYDVTVGLFRPDGHGGVSLDTQSLSDPVTHGGGSVIVADFNGDQQADIVLMAHNEDPMVAQPSVAFMSNGAGGFTKVTLPGSVMAHDAELAYIGGQPAVITGTFSPGDGNPTYTYGPSGWTEHLSASLAWGGLGMDGALAEFAGPGRYELARGDVGVNYISPGVALENDIAIYSFDLQAFGPNSTGAIPQPIQTIVPYLSTLQQYKDTQGWGGKGLTHVSRLWAEDLNHDGKLDLLAGESMWTAGSSTYPSALQILLNKGDGTFQDATGRLNPDMGLASEEMDYSPTFMDIDHSGIDSLMFARGSSNGASRQANYLLLNDGTGRLYVALHDEFAALQSQVTAYLNLQYPESQNYFLDQSGASVAKFIALPQADGSVNYVAEQTILQKDAATGLWGQSYAYVNVPIHYNPTTDFKQNVSIADRNGSTLIRTWAGDDTVADIDGGSSAHIDGGAGQDVAVYSGALGQYVLGLNSDGSVSVSAQAGAIPQVKDTLVNIETLKFSDAALSTADLALVGGWFGSVLREATSGPHAGLAAQTALALTSGQETSTEALQAVLKQAAATSSVATLAYEFFTGQAPSAAGMDYLVSPTGPNPNNLNSPYYQSFGLENRYINFASNLGRAGAGSVGFSADYGSLTPEQAMTKAYQTIFGGTPSADKVGHLLHDLVPDGLGGSYSRLEYFQSYGGDGPSGIGTKAAMVGWLLAEAVKADLGTYAKSNDAFLTDVALHNAPFAIDIIGHYAQSGFVFQPG